MDAIVQNLTILAGGILSGAGFMGLALLIASMY